MLDPGSTQLGIHLPAALRVEMTGLGDDELRGVLADPSPGQQRADAGQLEVQRPGGTEPAGSVERRHTARQRDLIADPAPDRLRIQHVVGDLRLHLRPGEAHHLRVLGGSRCRL